MLRSAVARLPGVKPGSAPMSGLLGAQPVASLCNYNCPTLKWVAGTTGLRRCQRSPASSFGSLMSATANSRSTGQPEELLAPCTAPPVSAEWQPHSTSLDAQATSDALNLTWLTHWQHAEAQRQFRRQVFESTRGRQVQRQQWLRDALSDAEPSSDVDGEMRIVNGRFSMASEQRTTGGSRAGTVTHSESSSSDSSEEMDDLTWLASHPEALGQSTGEGDSAASLATWTRQAAEESTDASAVQLRVGGESVSVRPLWIAVHQPEGSVTASLFESAAPLQAEIVDRLRVDITPFCSIDGLEFGAFADMQHAPWMNYFVGLVGDVAVEEHDILWPNQILHRDRVLYNVRSAADVARFLADPRREDVEEHMANLMRLAEERRYRRGWAWHMLMSRWGKPTLDELKIRLP